MVRLVAGQVRVAVAAAHVVQRPEAVLQRGFTPGLQREVIAVREGELLPQRQPGHVREGLEDDAAPRLDGSCGVPYAKK